MTVPVPEPTTGPFDPELTYVEPDPISLTDLLAKADDQADDLGIVIVYPEQVRALCEALRIAVEALHEVAVDHEPMPVNGGRDWCSKCQNYMRGDSGCTAADATAALAAVRELVDLGEKP